SLSQRRRSTERLSEPERTSNLAILATRSGSGAGRNVGHFHRRESVRERSSSSTFAHQRRRVTPETTSSGRKRVLVQVEQSDLRTPDRPTARWRGQPVPTPM